MTADGLYRNLFWTAEINNRSENEMNDVLAEILARRQRGGGTYAACLEVLLRRRFIMQNTHIHFPAFTPATANIYRQPPRQLMRAEPPGTVEVVLNLVFADLTKDLSFWYIPALPPRFSGMNKGHLKWFGLETKGGLLNPAHREQLNMCVYPSAGVTPLSLLSPKHGVYT